MLDSKTLDLFRKYGRDVILDSLDVQVGQEAKKPNIFPSLIVVDAMVRAELIDSNGRLTEKGKNVWCHCRS